MNISICECEICGKVFNRPTKEVARNIWKGRRVFCSRSCSGKAKTAHLISTQWTKKDFPYASYSGDIMSPFKETYKRCKNKHQELNFDVSYLKEIWDSQNGYCPYLQCKLILPLTTGKHDKSNPNLIASLDRIDSSKGYVKGNVRFISLTLNYAKNKFDESVLLNLIEIIKHGTNVLW